MDARRWRWQWWQEYWLDHSEVNRWEKQLSDSWLCSWGTHLNMERRMSRSDWHDIWKPEKRCLIICLDTQSGEEEGDEKEEKGEGMRDYWFHMSCLGSKGLSLTDKVRTEILQQDLSLILWWGQGKDKADGTGISKNNSRICQMDTEVTLSHS